MIKTLKQKLIYENKWIRLWEDEVEFPNGKRGIYAYFDRVDSGPMIIPMTDDGKFVMLHEWRYPTAGWQYNFPCGGCDEGEDMLSAAKRELEEETGIQASEWIDLGDLAIDPGGTSQVAKVFLARGLSFGVPKESYDTQQFFLEKIEQMITQGEIRSGWTLSGYAKLKVFLSQQ